MGDIPVWVQILVLVVMLAVSGFFSIAETAMMAINRYRLKHLVKQGKKGAILAAGLLAQTDRLLGVILLGNTFVNAATTALVTAIAISWLGNDENTLAIATGVVAFLILVFSEITPKVIGAAYPEKIALPAAFLLKPMLWLASPVVWFVNLFVAGLLRLMRINVSQDGEQRLSPEELRSMVLEGGHFMPKKTHSILVNLFDLERVQVDDIMSPRSQIEAINLADGMATILRQLKTSYHTRLMVYESDPNNVKGLLHLRKAMALVADPGSEEEFREGLRAILNEPYYVPASTPVSQQMQFFQENRERIALVVDEYGQIQGLVTLEDIVEQIIGEYTTTAPLKSAEKYRWAKARVGDLNQGETVVVEGSSLLRELNRQLLLQFPLDGPKTLNGLILESLQDIPESGVSLKINGCAMEVVQTEDRIIKTVRLRRPIPEVDEPLQSALPL